MLKPLVTTSSGPGSRSERSSGASTGKDPAVEQSSPRITLAEGDIHPNDHLVVELVDGKETPQVVLIHWPWMKDTRCCRDKAVGQVSACDPGGAVSPEELDRVVARSLREIESRRFGRRQNHP